MIMNVFKYDYLSLNRLRMILRENSKISSVGGLHEASEAIRSIVTYYKLTINSMSEIELFFDGLQFPLSLKIH